MTTEHWGGAKATWDDLYRLAIRRTGQAREARWMVEEVSDERLGQAPGRPNQKVQARLAAMLERRAGGEPLQYVLGSWAFRRLDLMVDRRVLIPRPETEQVVEVALGELDRIERRSGQRATVVDLGTGSGAIALSLASERTNLNVWATDRCPGAVAVARANLAGLAGGAATRVRIVEGEWWAALPADLRRTVDLVVSNPPYISTAEMATLDANVRDWEPREALEAGPRGTEAVESILAEAPRWLDPRGVAVIEVAPHQADQVVALARAAGFGEAEVLVDLSSRPRVLVARMVP